jgi:hypothetical protein
VTDNFAEGASMGWLLILVLALGFTNDPNRQATDTKPDANAAHAERSLVKEAIEGVSVLAGKITPIQSGAAADGKTEEASPSAVVWVHLSRKYLADTVERSVDHEKPARENVLGIIFTGKSHTTGKTHLVLHPNDQQAAADVEFTGTVQARTIGHSGPATLEYLSESTFQARKPLVVGDSGVSTSTAVVDAPTRLIPTNIATSLPGLRGRIGDRIARRRESGSRAQAEAIVSRDTADDIRHDFNVKLDAAVADIQSKVQTQIAALKLNDEDGAVVIRSRSTPDFVEVALCPGHKAANELQMAQSSPFEGNPDCAVRVHRSLVPSLLANAGLREKFAPMLTTSLIASDATHDSGPKIGMRGEWVAIDLATPAEVEPDGRVAVTQSGTSR